MTETMTGCVGTPQWMAPEVLRGEHYSEKADVYSFGVLIWEMVTGQVPHAGIPPFRLIALLANQDVRLPIPKNCSASLRRLMKKCMHKEPTKRYDIICNLEKKAECPRRKRFWEQNSLFYIKMVTNVSYCVMISQGLPLRTFCMKWRHGRRMRFAFTRLDNAHKQKPQANQKSILTPCTLPLIKCDSH